MKVTIDITEDDYTECFIRSEELDAVRSDNLTETLKYAVKTGKVQTPIKHLKVGDIVRRACDNSYGVVTFSKEEHSDFYKGIRTYVNVLFTNGKHDSGIESAFVKVPAHSYKGLVEDLLSGIEETQKEDEKKLQETAECWDKVKKGEV